jgi:hypothetical protein
MNGNSDVTHNFEGGKRNHRQTTRAHCRDANRRESKSSLGRKKKTRKQKTKTRASQRPTRTSTQRWYNTIFDYLFHCGAPSGQTKRKSDYLEKEIPTEKTRNEENKKKKTTPTPQHKVLVSLRVLCVRFLMFCTK